MERAVTMGKKFGIVNLVVGALLASYAGWYLFSGPFLGRELPPQWFLLGALGMFLLGLAAMSWGAKSYLYASEAERVTPPEGHV